MRHINIEAIANTEEVQQFKQLEREYLLQMQAMTTEERKMFIRTNTDWNILQNIMYSLSHRKCWYSEAPIGAGEFVIDHFRPKNRSKQYKYKLNDINVSEENNELSNIYNGQVINTNGYWWLAYNWRNYRLVGSLVNMRRSDRFSEGEEVNGKGDYFPLDLTGGSYCTEPPNDNLDVEVPLLLDPLLLYDTTLISFDKDGSTIVFGNAPEDDKFRAEISIELFHLDLEQLKHQRTEIWRLCEGELYEYNKQLIKPVNAQAKRLILNKACIRLKELTSPSAPFSKVAWACIFSHEKRDIYNKWLPNLIPSLSN
ncbi:MAG: hypothetical protein ABI723_23695 [Bacteroidia bacterium]